MVDDSSIAGRSFATMVTLSSNGAQYSQQMSSSIPIYTVSEHGLKAIAGCKDDELFEQLVRAGSDRLCTPLPEKMSALELMNALVGRPPLRRALRNILYGLGSGTPSEGFYVNAYEILVQHFSIGYFENWIQVSRPIEWIEKIQTSSSSINVNLDFEQLLFGGGLIELPTGNFAEIGFGFWASALVKKYKQQVDAYLASDVCESDADPMRKLNYPMHDIAKWLDNASQREDGAIVALYIQ